MAARRALAAGSARAAKPAIRFSLGSGRPHDPAAAFEMGATWRDLCGRPRAAERQFAGVAAYTEWNNSLIYSTTAGYLAARIAGAPPMLRPVAPVVQLPFNEIRELQQ